MKKFFALVLAVALVGCMSTTSFAYDYTQNNLMDYYGYGETTINAKIYSACYVSIPETIDYVYGTNWDVAISDMAVEDGYAIRVSVSNLSTNGSISLSNPNEKRTLNYYIEEAETHRQLSNNDRLLCELKYSDISVSEYVFPFTGHLDSETLGMKPGIYTGTMQYEVRIEPCE